jgi:hypothetical protein
MGIDCAGQARNSIEAAAKLLGIGRNRANSAAARGKADDPARPRGAVTPKASWSIFEGPAP